MTSYHSTTLQEVGILPTLVYFHSKARLALFPPLVAVLAMFSSLRSCLAGFFCLFYGCFVDFLMA